MTLLLDSGHSLQHVVFLQLNRLVHVLHRLVMLLLFLLQVLLEYSTEEFALPDTSPPALNQHNVEEDQTVVALSLINQIVQGSFA